MGCGRTRVVNTRIRASGEGFQRGLGSVGIRKEPGARERRAPREVRVLPLVRGARADGLLQSGSWMRQAGLVELRARSLGGAHLGPMDQATQDSISGLLSFFFGDMEKMLPGEDWGQHLRITDPESPDYLPRLEDWYCSLTCSLFIGEIPANHGD